MDASLQRILDTVAQVIESRSRRDMTGRLGEAAQRVGLRSPGLARIEGDRSQKVNEQLGSMLSEMLMQQRGEERQDKLTEEQWERELGLNRMNAEQQMNYLREQLQATSIENEKTRQLQLQRDEAERQWQEKLFKRQEKSASKSAWTSLLTSAGLGMLTGGVGAAAGLMPGMKAGTGALLGGLTGGTGAANMLGQGLQSRSIADFYNKYFTPQVGTGQDMIGSYPGYRKGVK